MIFSLTFFQEKTNGEPGRFIELRAVNKIFTLKNDVVKQNVVVDLVVDHVDRSKEDILYHEKRTNSNNEANVHLSCSYTCTCGHDISSG